MRAASLELHGIRVQLGGWWLRVGYVGATAAYVQAGFEDMSFTKGRREPKTNVNDTWWAVRRGWRHNCKAWRHEGGRTCSLVPDRTTLRTWSW